MTVLDEPPPHVAPPNRAMASFRHGRVADILEHYGLILIFGVMIAVFGLWSKTGPVFLSGANLRAIVSNQMVLLVVAVAAMLPLSCGYFDLSPGAGTGTAAIATATIMSRFHQSPALAIICGILVGALIGSVNGLLIAKFKFSAIIVTLAMSTALTGLDNWYTGGGTIGNIPLSMQNFGSLNWLGIPRLAFVVVPLLVLVWYVEDWTPLGRYQRAIRSASRSARLVGIAVDRVLLLSFVSAGALAGIAGVLLCAQSASADATTGPSMLFPALTAVFLGATAIRPGRINTPGTVVGVFFIAFSVSGLTLAGANSWVNDVFDGVALFVAGGLATVFSRQRGARSIL